MQLHDAMRHGKGKKALDKILKDLVGYTQTHFTDEERIMRTNGYPGYAEHKAKHDKLTEKVLKVQKDYHEGNINITFDVMDFLENWVDKHIMGTDKNYAPFLNGKGVV